MFRCVIPNQENHALEVRSDDRTEPAASYLVSTRAVRRVLFCHGVAATGKAWYSPSYASMSVARKRPLNPTSV